MKRTLYKYMSIASDERLQWMLGYLEGKAYFSSPSVFNDPFELGTPIRSPTDDETDEAAKNINEGFLGLSKSKQAKVRRRVQDDAERQGLTLSTETWLRDIGVLCLTEKPFNLLMWSHYADCHRGICIGFDSGMSIFCTFEKIRYLNERPQLPFGCNTRVEREHLNQILFTKAIEWEYEQEWRAVRRTVKDDEKKFYRCHYEAGKISSDEVVKILVENSGPGIYEFDASSIRRIYFGAKIDELKKAKISQHVKHLGLNVKLVQLSLDHRHYMLCNKQNE